MMNKRLKNRLWLVTCLALAIITTYTIYRYYCVHRIGDSDFYWHIMLGKNAISAHLLFYSSVLSFAASFFCMVISSHC